MTTLQPGQMLGPYQITSQIGKGGMAAVYKAYHAAMDRYVALKVVATQLVGEPGFLQRFRQEARLIAKLEHPNILPVYDFGEADGIPYMVMRFLEAGTLKERLDAGQLSLAEIDPIFTQLANALEYAHENGVIHRDIKPSNAMLDKRGDVFLTDFGVAKMLEGSSGLTATGAVTGTPAYMSPEQAQGNKVDQRSDIYSLGVMLFEMLTGRVPFEAETPMAVLFKQIQDPPPPLSVVRPDLPHPLEAVLLKALAKSPGDRYASMNAFRDSWKQALAQAATLPQGQPAAQAVGPALAAAETLQREAPVAPPAAKKGFNWKPFAIALPLLLVVACLVLGFLFRGRLLFLLNRLQAGARGGQATEQVDATPAASPGATRSWAGANTVYSIGFRNDEVLAAGPGSLTIWNRKNGSYKQITTADGLPGANLDTVFVDDNGSIWIGTDTGLMHVQGDKRDVYTGDQGLDSSSILAVSRLGERLFAGSRYSGIAGGGLNEFNAGNGKAWKQVKGFPSSENPGADTVSYNVHDITADKQGNLWVATELGLAMLDGNGKWQVFKTESGLPDNSVNVVYIDRDGGVWVGTSKSGVAKFNREKGTFESFANLGDKGVYDIYAMLQDREGNFWFVGGGVARYTADTQAWDSPTADGLLPDAAYLSGAMDDQGALYFGTAEKGLVRYANEKADVSVVPNVPRFAEYGRILSAPDGKLVFVQVYESGVEQFDPADESWQPVPPDRHIPRAFDSLGNMWSGGWDGLWIFSGEKVTAINSDHGLPSNQVNAIAFAADGSAYIATDKGIARLESLKVTDVYTAAKNGLASDEVFTLFVASDGVLWAGTRGGFSRRAPDGTWQHFTAQALFGGSENYFARFAEDREHNIWVASGNDGVYRFANGEWKRLISTDPGVDLPSDYVTSVTLAPDGALWFGTDGNGAARYDGQAWKPYKEGLINQHINDIYVDANGTVWFTTEGGITRLKP